MSLDTLILLLFSVPLLMLVIAAIGLLVALLTTKPDR